MTMSKITELFQEEPVIIDLGIEAFQEELTEQHVEANYLNWAPPGQGKATILVALEKIETPENLEKIKRANEEAVNRIISSQISLIGYDQAINVVPGMTKNTILHAGPPITWEKMNGPMKGAVKGALVFEGLAKDLDDAERVAASGEIIFSPCHEHQCVGSMAGVTSASMYMHIVENKTYGNWGPRISGTKFYGIKSNVLVFLYNNVCFSKLGLSKGILFDKVFSYAKACVKTYVFHF